MGKINYVNDQLEEERKKRRQPVQVRAHNYELEEIAPHFWAAQDPYMRETDPQTLEPLVVYCRNSRGMVCKYPVDEIIYVSRGQPKSGGTAIAYKVRFGERWRILWHDEKEWFTDKDVIEEDLYGDGNAAGDVNYK